jgi:hypothetical protein
MILEVLLEAKTGAWNLVLSFIQLWGVEVEVQVYINFFNFL